ncbi:hypothetical protein MPAN_001070 [Mariniplasma anaerobium]|uniref:Uncharacterized protein n=1 Tax=Mariniplasma anaerobium TaxID=2735436 RepID=A0A7U9THL8_9MOLU|nr:hypothetical protein MPAN_001070 [Mariniplasma anaerobium]
MPGDDFAYVVISFTILRPFVKFLENFIQMIQKSRKLEFIKLLSIYKNPYKKLIYWLK